MSNERDKRTTTSPPAGSEAEKALRTAAPMTLPDPEPHHRSAYDDDDPEDTDIGKPPWRRRATKEDISRIERTVTDYIEIDRQEHREIRDDLKQGMAGLSTKLDASLTTRDAKLDAFGLQLSTVATQSAVTAAHTERLVAVVDSRAQADIRLATAQKEADIQTQTSTKKTRNDLIVKIATWLTPIFTALAAGAVALIEHCRG